MCAVLNAQGKVILDEGDFDKIKNNLEEIRANNERLEKMVWLFSNCDSRFVEEMLPKIDRFDEKELTFLWETYQSMSNYGSQGIVAGERARHSTFDESKEDIREVIFGVRRDGELKGLRSIKDIKI